jgi:hypothetical protein
MSVEVPLCIGSDCSFIGWQELFQKNIMPALFILFICVGACFYYRFHYQKRSFDGVPSEVLSIESVQHEHLTFLATYIIPLVVIDLNEPRNVIVLFSLLAAIGVIYVKTNLFYVNPSLALLGYHIYKIKLKIDDEGTDLILISKERVEAGNKILYKKLDKKVYFGKRLSST